MATMKMTGCMKIVARMPQADQDALLARLDQYQADGIPADQAQMMAANDMLEELRAERTQIFDAIAEQFPDLLTAPTQEAAAPEVTLSRQRSFYRDLLPEAGYDRITDQDSPKIYKDKSGNAYATFEKDGARAAFSSNNILYEDDRGRVAVGYGEENESVFRALIVDSGKRQQGKGTAVMQDVINAADASGTVLYLEPAPIEGNKMSAKQLADFYKRFGFEQAKEGSDKVLVRQPAQATLSRQRNSAEDNWENVGQQGDMFAGEFANKNTRLDTGIKVNTRGDTLIRGNVNNQGQQITGTKQGLFNFWNWFGNSAVQEKGKPTVVYHTTRSDISKFETMRESQNVSSLGSVWTVRRSGIFFTPDLDYSQEYGAIGGRFEPGANVIPVYLSIQNPIDFRQFSKYQDELAAALEAKGLNPNYVTSVSTDWELFDNIEGDDFGEQFVATLKELGYDGAIITEQNAENEDVLVYVAFDSTQVKSVTGNQGTFDPNNPDITLSRRRNYGTLTADQEQALRNVGGIKPDQTVRERMEQLKTRFADTWVGGVFDQFAELRKLDPKAYILARLSKGTDGTLEALMLYGKPFLTKDGVADVNINDGGFAKVLGKLEGEQDRFLWWVAAQRAERLKAQGLENLFTDQDITSLKALDQGNLPSGKARGQAYADALKEMNEFNDAVLEVAEKSGLIDPEARRLFKDTPYVPFYRVMESEDGVAGPTFSSGLVNQYAWKKLKGGKQKLNEDLLTNVLLNWSHLYAAAAKNRAASASLQAGVQAGVAEVVPAGTKGSVRVRENGKEVHYLVTDPGVMAAIGAIEYRTPGFFKPFSTMKRWLSIGVTANPTYKVKNLMRDSLSSIAVSDLSANAAKNVTSGFKATSKDSQTFASMMAGGGLIRFGAMLDGDNSARTRRLIEREGGQLLDAKGWAKLGRMMADTWHAYNELGDRFENANRAALYEQLRAKGYSEIDANFMSRDLMDFSMSGRWPVVRFLVETVPFMNARLQGLYKLGRGAKENPKKFGYTVGAVALASLALMLAYGDDEDWKKRPDWDRDANWWFKIGDTAFRIPKPFEVGAIGTIAERGWELAFNKEMTMRRFGQRMSNMIFDTFAMDATPQIIKPIFDVYANKAQFTNLPIEGMGMERLRPEDRYNDRTSYAARFLGQLGLPNPAGLARGEYDKLSPVQIDYLLKGYFGWLGTASTTVMDFGIRPMMGGGERPDMRLKDMFFAGNFVETLPSSSSRYVDQLYEQSRLIEEAYNSHRAALKRGDVAAAKEIMAEEGDKIRRYKQVQNVSDRVAELNTKIRQIEAAKSMSGETKRRLIDMLRSQQDKLAKAAAPALR